MTKAEYIERYGIEGYELHKARTKEDSKNLYNDPIRRELQKERSRKWHKEHYIPGQEKHKCLRKYKYVEAGRIDLIENYELAKADDFNNWCIHHRLELHPDYSVRYTKDSLIRLELYYNRPPNELIWMKHDEHSRIHNLYK